MCCCHKIKDIFLKELKNFLLTRIITLKFWLTVLPQNLINQPKYPMFPLSTLPPPPPLINLRKIRLYSKTTFTKNIFFPVQFLIFKLEFCIVNNESF